MRYYFAPMEGLTGFVYRNAHRRLFPHMDGYFTPFLSPTQNHRFTPRERSDILPEHNRGIPLVPQLMTCHAEDFIWAAKELKGMGYGEVNLNLGCPSGTVTAKGKGAGFLAYPEKLDRFLDEIFRSLEMDISVKTRLGVSDPAEFSGLLEIFNRYPIKELIIHPRVRADFYKNTPDLDAFKKALTFSKNQVWYNGDLFSEQGLDVFSKRFPEVENVMMGRGLVSDPSLGGAKKGFPPLKKDQLRRFHDEIYGGYMEVIQGEKNVLFKMKELWSYWLLILEDSEKGEKKIRKAKNRGEYEAAVNQVFAEGVVRHP